MNSTPDEFRGALERAFGCAVSADESGLLLTTDASTLHFALSHETPYKIGAIEISLLRVEISIKRGDEHAARILQEQVDRATQRGGG
jgi:hypothetical protein